jgi:t-SNARE complex subunit (syntaxin)
MADSERRSPESAQEQYRRWKSEAPTRRERLMSYLLLAVFLVTIIVVAVLFAVFVLLAPRA